MDIKGIIDIQQENINKIAERTVDNNKLLKQQLIQRRTQVTDLYGIEYTRQGDVNSPAKFYISISRDYQYFSQFAFKLHVQPFVTTVGKGLSETTIAINNTSLEVTKQTNPESYKVTPNPHTHTSNAHSHNVVDGLRFINSRFNSLIVKINGVDITDKLIYQMGGSWIHQEGIYPDAQDGVFDILQVASQLVAEGRTTDANKILSSGYLPVEVIADAPFQVTMALYLKYPHVNR